MKRKEEKGKHGTNGNREEVHERERENGQVGKGTTSTRMKEDRNRRRKGILKKKGS